MSKESENIPGVLKGNLNYMILRALRKGPLHGYAIIKAIEGITGELWKPTTGSVYPALAQLEKDGLIGVKREEGKGRKRKFYCITRKGAAELQERRRMITSIIRKTHDMFHHLFPKDLQEHSQLLTLIEESKFLYKDIVGVKLNFVKMMQLSKQGKVSVESKQAVKKKIQELNKLILDAINTAEKKK